MSDPDDRTAQPPRAPEVEPAPRDADRQVDGGDEDRDGEAAERGGPADRVADPGGDSDPDPAAGY